MPPKLAVLYPAPRSRGAPPPIFTRRNLALPLAAVGFAFGLWILGEEDLGTGCAAVASAWVAQLVAPAIRRRSLRMSGWVAELLFAAPFVLFFLPYVAWTVAVRPPFQWSWVGVVLAVVVGAAAQATDWRRLAPGFDRVLLGLMPPMRLVTVVLRSYQTLAAAIGQELLYRGVLYTLMAPTLGWTVVPVSTALFVLEHMGNRWAATLFSRAYLLRVGGLSLALATVAYATGSLWAAVLGHIAFNLVPVAQLGFRYAVSERFGELDTEDLGGAAVQAGPD